MISGFRAVWRVVGAIDGGVIVAAVKSLPHWDFQEAGGDGSAFVQVALRHGVAVLPGSALDPTGGSADRLRIPFTAPPDR